MKRREMIKTIGAAALAAVFTAPSLAFDGPELYKGEKELYEAAKKEGMVVSFDTGPEWANWKSLFRDFKKRYPDIEMTYNDIGSAAIGQVIVFAAAYGNGGSANNIKPGTDYRAETGFRVFPMRQSGVIALSVSYITTSVKVVVADQR